MSVKVVLNEQHSLMPNQEEVLNEEYKSWEIFGVPAGGWTAVEMEEKVEELKGDVVIFASPVPALMALLARTDTFRVLHNDRREKKELPNGRIIMTVAKTGWQIV